MSQPDISSSSGVGANSRHFHRAARAGQRPGSSLAATQEFCRTVRSILVAEDEPLIGLVLEDVLAGAGFEVLLAASSEAAIAIIDARAMQLSGLVTDIQLGDRTSGWELARYARFCNPEIPVVYISGTCGGDWSSQGVPVSQFVGKPFKSSEILSALAALLSNSEQSAA